ncbi:hypothetical protein F5Y19DRAFT_485534 [Xylariaceae sp. FL1651]|nr:hypothetical protein F5Y19DRAFT_485534 [Xylariaceae sp. FL1651]
MPNRERVLGLIRPETHSSQCVATASSETTKWSTRVPKNDRLEANRENDLKNGSLLRELRSTLTTDEAHNQLRFDPKKYVFDLNPSITPQLQAFSSPELFLSQGESPVGIYSETLMASTLAYNRNNSTPYARPIPQQLEHRQTNSSENSNSDRGSENEAERCLPESVFKNRLRRVDCPFYKRNPALFQRCCKKGYKSIAPLKAHLRDSHQQSHCKICLQTISPERLITHVCDGYRPKEVLFLTDYMLACIKHRADPKQGLEEQWRKIYNILFPSDQPPFPDPYVGNRRSEAIEHFAKTLRENYVEVLQMANEYVHSQGLVSPEDQKRLQKKAFEEWLSRKTRWWISLEAASLDNKTRLRAAGVQSIGVSEQNMSRERAPRLASCHQSAIYSLPPIEQSFRSDSCNYTSLGLSTAQETSMDMPVQDGDSRIDDNPVGFSASDNQSDFHHFDTELFSNMPEMGEDCAAFPVEADLQFEQLNHDIYSGRSAEPSLPGARLGQSQNFLNAVGSARSGKMRDSIFKDRFNSA